ncbi:MAG: response regulator [Paracoccaceae bacterium]
MDGTILIADDDRTIRTVLTQALTRAGCKVHATSSLVTLLRWVEEGKGDLVISDVVMPDGNGLEALPKISKLRPGLPVIVISAQNNIMTAIQAAEAEAYDYLPKPFDLPDLMKRSARALDAKSKNRVGNAIFPSQADDLPLVGKTPAMQALYQLVARVMNTDLPVLITGESGTGKSLIARAIHDLSDRRSMPFVVVGAGDFEDSEIQSVLATRARNGTVLFDEVGDLDLQAQAKLVRILDALDDNAPRIMAVSQANLTEMMESDKFRSDLFYRLGGITISVPPLRQRVDDIALLSEHFLVRAQREGQALRRLLPDALELMRNFTWPGNVRQLENIIRRLVLNSQVQDISKSEMASVLGSQPVIDSSVTGGRKERLTASVEKHLRRYFELHGGVLPPPGLYPRILREIELPLIEIALEATGGNQAKCADLLGINRNTLRKKITELDIRVTRRRKLM